MRRTRWAFLIGLSLAAASVGHPAVSQNAVRIDAADGPALAQHLLSAGQPRAAQAVAEALIEANPEASRPYILLAQALYGQGETAEAREAGRKAWRLASDDRERFTAAFTMADLLAADEAYTRSQLWIRRAIQVAPGPESERVAIEAFRRVRVANPLAVELDFGLSPSSNVNSGNSNDRITFAYLPGVLSELEWLVPDDQRPLSGLEISLQTQLRYRIATNARSQTSLELGAYGRTYVMSDEARATAPEVTGESLSYMRGSLGVLHQWVGADTNRPYSASLTFSQDWAGGSPYRVDWDATLGTRYTLANEDRLSVSAGVRWTDRLTSDAEVITYSLRSQWLRELANKDVVSLSGQLARARSDATDLAYTSATIGVSYDFGEIGPGFDLAASLTQEYRDYETSVFDPAGRDDVSTALRLDLGLQNVQFYGFQPVISITGRRTQSTVDRFDTEGVQMGLDLRSSF